MQKVRDPNSTNPLIETRTEPPEFWSASPYFNVKYGRFHQANTDSLQFLPGVLLVFVHGINSDATKCWKDLPWQILTLGSTDVDILNFQYPAGLCSNTSIPEVASQLGTLLSQLIEKSRYKDIIFSVHSAGGLVVKQVLISDFEGKRNIFSRTRQIFNFGVPHAGSTVGYSELARRACVFIEYAFWPVTSFVRFVSLGAIGLGRNKIYCALKHNGKFVTALEQKYVNIIIELDRSKHPRPVSIEISAGNDTVSDGRTHASDNQQIRVRENHSSMKYGQISIRAVADHIVFKALWEKHRIECDATVAHLMVARVTVIEKVAAIPYRLFREEQKELAAGLDQARCLARLRELINEPRERTVVSGPMQVGKSVVLRRLCKEECQRFIGPDGNQPKVLVLFFPIDRLMLDEEQGATEGVGLWMALCRAWIKHSNELLRSSELPPEMPKSVLTLSWLIDRLHRDRTVVILDGVDEFIANHRQVTVQTFSAALPLVNGGASRGDIPKNDIHILLGARDSLYELETLCRGSMHLRLSLLNKETLAKKVPALASKIDRMNEADKQLLSTPLVVTELSNVTHVPKEYSATKILQVAVESIRESSSSCRPNLTLETFAFVGWIYYRRFRRELSISEMREEAEKLLAEWQQHLSEWATDDPRSKTLGGRIQHLKAVSNVESLTLLLKHPFFFPTKSNYYSFSNEGWRDFFVTYYLSLCVRYHHAAGLGGIAFHVEHYERAGDFLDGFLVDDQVVSGFVSRGQVDDDPFILGNLASVLGVSNVAILTSASKTIARACGQDMHLLGRFVAISRLAGRAATRIPAGGSDFSAVDIRAALSQVLPEILRRQDCDKVMHSLCSCCLRELGFSGELRILLNAEQSLEWIWDRSPALAERTRSVQMSFLSAQYTTRNNPERSVAHVHYLFLLTVARFKGWAIPEVCRQLPAFLEPGSPTEAHYKSYQSVHELYDIYRLCQQMWHAFNNPEIALASVNGEGQTVTAERIADFGAPVL